MEADAKAKRKAKRARRRWTLLGVVAVVALLTRLLLPDAVGEQVRRSFLGILQTHYPGLEISIASGRYEPEVGVVLAGIVIRDAQLPTTARPLLRIERLIVETELDPARLRDGQAPLLARRVIVDGAEINIWPEAEGRWSSQKMWPPPEMGPGVPLMVVSGGRVRFCQNADAQHPAIELQPIALTVRQSGDEASGVTREFVARGMGGCVESFALSATFHGDGALAATGSAKRLKIDPHLFERLPPQVRQRIRPLLGLTASIDVDARLAGTVDDPLRRWGARCSLDSGRFEHVELPFSVERISGVMRANPAGVTIEESACTIDGAVCRTSGRIAGLGWPCPVTLRVDADNLMLDRRAAAVLPAEGRVLWDKIQPNGRIDLRGNVRFDGQRWDFDTDVRCHDLAVDVAEFPYPLKNVTGVVHYRNRVATTKELTCRAGDTQLNCAFQLAPRGSDVEHFIEIQADGPLQIDETLVSALTPRGKPTGSLEEFVRSISPGGSIQLLGARIGRTAAGEPTRHLDLKVLGGRLHYEKFPYPLYDVRGRIVVDDHTVRLSHFEAQNSGGATIQCDGVWLSAPGQDGGKLDLAFHGYDVPLDDGLRTALPPSARQTWDTLAPSGVLEHLEVNVVHGPEPGPPTLTLVAQQWGTQGQGRRDVSVTPVTLPYRLDISRGVVRLEDDRITISDLDGYHGSSRLSAEGQCQRRADGRWQLDLNVLTGSRLRPDAELIGSLPLEIRGSFAKLQLREPVSLRGTTRLILPSPELPTPIFSWDVRLQLEGNHIGADSLAHDIRGEVLVRGSVGGDEATADGAVRIDSMHIKELQLTEIEGPFSIRGLKLYIGGPAPPDSDQNVPVRGRIFGGAIEMQGELALSSGQFAVDIDLRRGDVAMLLADLEQAHAALSGTFGGSLHLEGIVGAANLLRGAGKAEVSHTNLYQLPLLVQVLNQLRLTPAEEVAFTDGATDFTIDGDLLTLSELQLWGDLVALQGGGTINGRREMDLTFNTRVSPQNAWTRLVRPLRSKKYTLWTINVRGTLADPKIERRALEAVGETFERMFPVMDRQGGTPSTLGALGPDQLRSALLGRESSSDSKR